MWEKKHKKLGLKSSSDKNKDKVEDAIDSVNEAIEDVHSSIPNSVRDQLASDSGFEDQGSVGQKPKKITVKITSATNFPATNCYVTFEIDGKQCGKSKGTWG